MRNIVFLLIAMALFACNTEQSTEGDVHFQRGEFALAVESYNEYLNSNPANIKTVYNRGRSYEELGQFEAAVSDFQDVLKMDEKNLSAMLSISTVRYEQKRYNQCLLQAEEALEIRPNSAQAHFLIARSKHQLGYVESAMESYDQALKINRDYGEAYLYRGALKVTSNNPRGACDDFIKARNLKVEGADAAYSKYCR